MVISSATVVEFPLTGENGFSQKDRSCTTALVVERVMDSARKSRWNNRVFMNPVLNLRECWSIQAIVLLKYCSPV